MRFASSFPAIFLKRVNVLDFLDLYNLSYFRFQVIYYLFIHCKESKHFLGEELMLPCVYL
jgi:hypothetical protein